MSRKIHIITHGSIQSWIMFYKTVPNYHIFRDNYEISNFDITLFLRGDNDKVHLYEYEILNDELVYIRTISKAEYRKLLLLK